MLKLLLFFSRLGALFFSYIDINRKILACAFSLQMAENNPPFNIFSWTQTPRFFLTVIFKLFYSPPPPRHVLTLPKKLETLGFVLEI